MIDFFRRIRVNHWSALIIGAGVILSTIFPVRYLCSFLRFPFPLEYREAASIVVADALHRGINAFALNSYPQDFYIYGLLFPFLIAPWMDTIRPVLLIPRLIDVCSLFLVVALLFAMSRKNGASLLGALVGSALLLNALCLVLKINGSRPDLPALLFSLCGVYIVWEKGTALRRLLLSAICALVCLLLKDYLIIPIGLVAAHVFLFQSKKAAILLLGALGGLAGAAWIVIRFAFPLYLREAILHPLYIAGGSPAHAMMQLTTFLEWYAPLWLLFLCSVGYSLLRARTSGSARWRVHSAQWDKPLFEGPAIRFSDWGFVAILIVLMISIARNEGNAHIYFQELPLPYLLLAAVPFVERSIRHPAWKSAAYGLCLLSLIPLASGYQTAFAQYSDAYRALEKRMDRCANIYGAPITDLYLLDRKAVSIYDDGLTEFGFTIISSKNPVFQKLLGGNDGQIENRWNVWNRSLAEKIRNQEFDCIAVDSQITQIESVTLADYYAKETVIPDVLDWNVIQYNIRVDIAVWVPKTGSFPSNQHQ